MKLKMTLANKITLIRAGMSIIMFLLMIAENGFAMIAASLIFGVAASTDWIDGRIARSTRYWWARRSSRLRKCLMSMFRYGRYS